MDLNRGKYSWGSGAMRSRTEERKPYGAVVGGSHVCPCVSPHCRHEDYEERRLLRSFGNALTEHNIPAYTSTPDAARTSTVASCQERTQATAVEIRGPVWRRCEKRSRRPGNPSIHRTRARDGERCSMACRG